MSTIDVNFQDVHLFNQARLYKTLVADPAEYFTDDQFVTKQFSPLSCRVLT